jgi:hypothetical protein
MARKRPKPASPVLTAAAICKKVLLESDGVPSLIRVVDQITVPDPSKFLPSEGGKALVVYSELMLFVALKSVGGPGQHELVVSPLKPSGKRRKGTPIPVNLLGPGTGANIRGALPVEVGEEGLHWFEVRVNGRLVTRIPLQSCISSRRQRSKQLQPTANRAERDRISDAL